MKTLTTIVFLLLTVKLAVANDIDKLKTIDDVQDFLVEKVNKKWKNETIFESNIKDSSVYGKGKFFKIDLDNNGLTDLVINGKYFFALTDNGKGYYESHLIDRGTFLLDKYTLINIVYKDKWPLLVISGYNQYLHALTDSTKTDTLVLYFGDFVEYNSTPDNLRIEEIKLLTSGCFGSCPIFELSINANRGSVYNAIKHNKINGKFKTTVDTITYNNIIATINYIKLIALKDSYGVGWTDDQTLTLEIKFNNGQTKKIIDYGAIGTFGLEKLYNQLFALRRNQKWK